MTTLFISDLHLSGEHPAVSELFVAFLASYGHQAQTLYILGDLFELWLGDDAVLPEHETVIQALHETSASGTDIAIMHGNRDLLLGEQFCQQSGCRLISDPCLIEINQEAVLLMHGDTLCTDDLEYQRFRQMVHDKSYQQAFLALPIAERLTRVQFFRQQSQQSTRQKAAEIMDVNQQAVIDVFSTYEVKRLIHGHTHRPAVHELEINGHSVQRMVLADWGLTGQVLMHNAQGWHSETFDLASLRQG